MTSVLITRPLASAQPLAASLQKLGYETIIEPLLIIVPIPVQRPEEDGEAVMITSANVFTALENRRREMADFFAQPCFCVGPHTAEKAKEFGFHDVRHSASDGRELAQLIAREKYGSVLHIAAHDIDSKAQDELEQRECRVISWPVYEAVPVTSLSLATTELLKNNTLDAVVVFSSRSAVTLNTLITNHALEACCSRLAAICLSEAIASALKPQKWHKVVAASRPTEDAVIASLQAACPVKA